jgi:hypothetical protein
MAVDGGGDDGVFVTAADNSNVKVVVAMIPLVDSGGGEGHGG